MVESNKILYPDGVKPDHCIVIKYVPFVGDSKRAMDEYTSEIMMGGRNTIVIHNTCEDSLLAAPIILDLVLIAELCQRISYRLENEPHFHHFNSVLSILSYLCKAPLVPQGTPVINSLFRQRACMENIFRACIGLPPINNMFLEHKHERICSKHSEGVNGITSVAEKTYVCNGNAEMLKEKMKNGNLAHNKFAVNGHTIVNGASNGHAENGHNGVNGHFH